jgi:hypothetical protein
MADRRARRRALGRRQQRPVKDRVAEAHEVARGRYEAAAERLVGHVVAVVLVVVGLVSCTRSGSDPASGSGRSVVSPNADSLVACAKRTPQEDEDARKRIDRRPGGSARATAA